MLNAFVPTCAVAFRTTYGKNKMRKCEFEGFIHVASLYGEIGFPTSFINSLIGIPVKYDLPNTLIKINISFQNPHM